MSFEYINYLHFIIFNINCHVLDKKNNSEQKILLFLYFDLAQIKEDRCFCGSHPSQVFAVNHWIPKEKKQNQFFAIIL